MTSISISKGLSALVVGASLLAVAAMPVRAEMPAPKEQFMSMGTSSAGGSFFPLAGAMAGVVAKHYPQLKINAEITGGSVDNVKLINNGKLELALISAQPVFEGVKGIGKFASTGPQKKHLGVMAGHGNVWQLYTLKKNGINSIKDLKGKKVSLGSTGSDGNSIGKEVIEAHGLVMNKDWTPEYISHGDGPGALRDGRVDAVLQLSSTPTATVIDITSTNGEDVVFVNPEPDVLAKLIEKYPYWSKAVIPGGVYKGHASDVAGTFKMVAMLCAADTVSAEAVYAIVKTLLENPAELTNANALGKFWNTKDALDPLIGVVALHPGAEAYYKEKGLLK